MLRRQLLAAGVSGAATVAGCLGWTNDAGTTETTYPDLSVESDSAPDSASVTVDVAVVREFGPDHPAGIRIALTNDGESEFDALFGPIPPFTTLYGERVEGTDRLLLVPRDRPHMRQVIPASPDNGTWRATGDVAVNATALLMDLDPDETVSRTYDLLAAADNDELSAGEYRFEAEDYLGHGSWGFTVSVSY